MDIRYSKKFPLYSIKFLEYFGAQDQSKDGYMFVPDGSGSLIYLNNHKNNAAPFSTPVYGYDNSIRRDERFQFAQRCCLPVFGMKQGTDAFFAIIEKGDTHASINADVSGRINSYNQVYAEFNTVPKDDMVMNSATGQVRYNVFQHKIYDGFIQVRYAFLNGDNANYSGMAKYYQNYLVDNNALRKITPERTFRFI